MIETNIADAGTLFSEKKTLKLLKRYLKQNLKNRKRT